MFETVVQLKPREQWRPGLTWQKLTAEMSEATKTPGMAQIFWMQIQTRTEMLTTGFRSVLGIKVFGPTLAWIQEVATAIEKALSDFPNTRSAFAERTTGGYFLDFTVNRQPVAPYGLRVEDVNMVVETAIGGNTIGTTVEGRERYPISVRYSRDFRDNLYLLKRVLVATPTGDQVPIFAREYPLSHWPPSIRDENGQLVRRASAPTGVDPFAGKVLGIRGHCALFGGGPQKGRTIKQTGECGRMVGPDVT